MPSDRVANGAVLPTKAQEELALPLCLCPRFFQSNAGVLIDVTLALGYATQTIVRLFSLHLGGQSSVIDLFNIEGKALLHGAVLSRGVALSNRIDQCRDIVESLRLGRLLKNCSFLQAGGGEKVLVI